MGKIWLLLGTLMLAAACSSTPSDCVCIGTAACYTATSTTETCGIGLVCCPPVADDGGVSDGG